MVFGITCPRCNGARGDTDCPRCMGRGDQWLYRCPNSLLSPDVRGLLRAWGAFQNGILPDPGAFYDQSASFIHAMGVLNAEKASLDKLSETK